MWWLMGVAFAATPGLVPIQGVLAHGDTVATGTRNVTFSLLGAGCTASRWTETQAVNLDHGLFSARLGQVTTLNLELFDEPGLCVVVQVDGGPPSTPVGLGVAPYAAHAHNADRLGGAPAADFVQRTESRPWSSLDLSGAPDAIRLGYAPGSGIQITGRTISAQLATVASTGSYLDLTDRPTSLAPASGSPFYLSSSGGSLSGSLSVSGALSTTGAVGVGTATPVATLDVGGSGAMKLPVGTTAQRPTSAVEGMLRYNSTTQSVEFYNGANWSRVGASFSATGGSVTVAGGYRVHTFTSSGTFVVGGAGANVQVLVVGGGGGGGGRSGGGGGGGGVVYNAAYAVSPGQTITVTVGAGGLGGSGDGAGNATNGENSVFGTITALGGGYGATDFDYDGNIGGSGGGGKYGTAGSAGTSGQGFAGGFGFNSPYAGGGGGGAGGAGVNGTATGEIGDGGPGFLSAISGTNTYYGGGGGGGGHDPSNGLGVGGQGGGGNGGAPGAKNPGQAGAANTGGGGGAGTTNSGSGGAGGNGGSGIVIVRYPVDG